MRKTNKILYTICFVLGPLFFLGCLFKSGVERKEWFQYASKYDQAMSKMVASGGALQDYNKMSKMGQKFLRAKQPTETEIISVLRSSNKRIQKVALVAMSLKPIETDQLTDILFEFLRDKEPEFRWYAMLSLDKFTKFPESKKADLGKQLLEIIKNEKDDALPLPQKFTLLAKFPSEEAALFLTEQLMKEGKESRIRIFRYAAFRALKEMGDSYYDGAAEYVNKHGSPEIKKELREWEKVKGKWLKENWGYGHTKEIERNIYPPEQMYLHYAKPPYKQIDASEIIEVWGNLGMYLPDDKDMAYIRSNLPGSLEILKKGLVHENSHVRMCAANVIEKLGNYAKSLGPNLRDAYKEDQDAINRVYFITALSAIEEKSSDSLNFLKNVFASEQNIQVRTYAAGALLTISGVDTKSEEWNWIKTVLFFDFTKNEVQENNLYWESCWGASYMLGKLGHRAKDAIPMLKHPAQKDTTPGWVKEQLKEDITKISEPRQNTQY